MRRASWLAPALVLLVACGDSGGRAAPAATTTSTAAPPTTTVTTVTTTTAPPTTVATAPTTTLPPSDADGRAYDLMLLARLDPAAGGGWVLTGDRLTVVGSEGTTERPATEPQVAYATDARWQNVQVKLYRFPVAANATFGVLQVEPSEACKDLPPPRPVWRAVPAAEFAKALAGQPISVTYDKAGTVTALRDQRAC